MIFVTVGTHEQPFNRLLKCIDDAVEKGIIKEKIVCQKGFTDYEPRNYSAKKLMPYEEMQKNIKEAKLVITHGGPASFLDPLKYGKIPIVVPRKKEFNEHVNDHQLKFAKEVERRMNNILVAENEDELIYLVTNYDKKIKKINKKNNSNNIFFNEKLEEIINDMF